MDKNSLLENIFKDRLKKFLTNYEFRPQQLQMAISIYDALESNKHLLVEAGTGIGKSLAYILPAVLYLTFKKDEQHRRIIISTYTKTLQNQLLKKDLPLAKNILKKLGINFRFGLLMGSEEFICLRRFEKFLNEPKELFVDEKTIKKLTAVIKTKKFSGMKSDIDFSVDYNFWQKICRISDLCMYRKSPFYNKCFYQRAKKTLSECDVVVINHALFFTNLKLIKKILPKFSVVIFDEAHMLEEVALNQLGDSISNFSVIRLLNEIYNPNKRTGIITKLKIPRFSKNQFIRFFSECSSQAKDFFNKIVTDFSLYENNIVRVKDFHNTENFKITSENFSSLADFIESLFDYCKTEEQEKEILSIIRRCKEVSDILASFLNRQVDFVYWIETAKRPHGIKILLNSVPLDISNFLKEKVFSNKYHCILTSATLTVNKDFSFLKQSLGIEDCIEVCLDSPFNYNDNCLIYIPSHILAPNEDEIKFQSAVIKEISDILKITKGGTFVLFTNYKFMNFIYNEIKQQFNGLKFFIQHEMDRYKILDEFRKNTNCVLFATDTFWQGVDVIGEALRCVIITRLPFDFYKHPLIEAKCEKLRQEGKNDFNEFQLPRAVLMFRQGFGRLIRSKKDYGVIVVLDNRILKKNYGKVFQNSIPYCNITANKDEVVNFYNMH